MERKPIPHPSNFIDSKYTDIINRYAAAAEQLGTLHPEQLAVIYQQKWFNLFVPKEYGGLQLSLMEGLQTEEGLAWADGSTGWTVTLCSGANWFIGFLHPEVTPAIFNAAVVCLAGSGRSSGIAKDEGDEYEITGYWNYASGATIATAFTANCNIEKNGSIMHDDDGNAIVYSFIFLRNEVLLHQNWKSVGMIATASNGFEVRQLKVKKNRCFVIDAINAVFNDSIYQYPFLHFAEATLAVNSSGMATRFFDLCEKLFEERSANKNYDKEINAALHKKLEIAKAQLQLQRQLFYAAVQYSWDEWIQNKTHNADTLKKVGTTSKQLAAVARKLVDEWYPYCGLAAANPATEINRVWRNLHTASQHPLLLQAH